MTSTNTPIVPTEEGQLQGIVENVLGNDTFVFKGIPYAQPPVGSLRWRRPEPFPPWTGVRPADKYGKSSYQNAEECIKSGGGDPGELAEDCLYLNVWTAPFESGAPPSDRPVMVWIHGGAYIIGAGGLPPYIGAPLVKLGAVVVTLNYRLGHMGFFAHASLDRENPEDAPVNNFGLLDQIAALEWVQRNIAKFGGNPDNVTIFGQSAGARSVLALCASTPAWPRQLFHKGIAQSAYGLPDATRSQALERGANVVDRLGLPGRDATAAQLRGIEADRFWRLVPNLDSEGKPIPISNAPVPISGDTVLPRPTFDTFLDSQEAPVPLILGNTSDDSSVVLEFGVDPVKMIEEFRKNGVFVGPLYPDIKNDDAELGRQVCRDLLFTLVPRELSRHHRTLAKTWRYYFEYTAVNLIRPTIYKGVRHGDEIPYMLGTCELCPPNQGIFTEADREFERHVTGYWFNFARSATPSPQGSLSPKWDDQTALRDTVMILGNQGCKNESPFMPLRMEAFLAAGGLRLIEKILNPPTDHSI